MRCIQDGVKVVTVTPTALKQTPDSTLDLLRKSGVVVREVEGNGRPRKLADGDIKKILAIRCGGMSFYKISNLTAIPKSTVFDYYKRYEKDPVGESDIEGVEIEAARRIFSRLLEADMDDEINELAAAGQKSGSIDEIGRILKEIEIILYC